MLHIELILLVLGLIGIWLGANLIVDAAQKIARSLNISEAFIGLTVLSVGTSLPEIFTHVIASINVLKGVNKAASVAVGTNIGSNIIQITFVVGLIGLLAKVHSDKKILKRDFMVMLGSIALLFLLSLNGFISRIEGIILASLYIIYLIYLGKEEKIVEKNPFKANYLREAFILIVGFAFLLFGANFVVNNAINISDLMGWSGSFIGAVIIGVGTALPELTTALVAILKGADSLSLGTLVGSNITNPLLALGIGAAISGYAVDSSLIFFDIPFWFFVSIIALLFFWRKLKIEKKEAIILICFYLAYVFVRIRFFIV